MLLLSENAMHMHVDLNKECSTIEDICLLPVLYKEKLGVELKNKISFENLNILIFEIILGNDVII